LVSDNIEQPGIAADAGIFQAKLFEMENLLLSMAKNI
jgi:hypothetical protein